MASVDTGGYTRRRLFRTASVASLAGIAGCLEEESPSGSSPASGTWPLERYGPRNTARAPDASAPTKPTVERAQTTGRATALVVAGSGEMRRVVVGGYEGLTAHHPDGTVAWRGREADTLSVRPGSGICYAGSGDAFRALTLADGTVHWSVELSGSPYGIVPSSRGPFVPFNGGIDAYDRDGNHRYRVRRGEGFGNAGVAVADAVYVTDVRMAERLSTRGVLRRLREKPPSAAWRVEREIGYGYVPIVDDGEVYVTNEGTSGTDGGVLALDADGAVRWNRSIGWRPQGAALGTDRLFVAMMAGDDSDRLVALHRNDGTTDWAVSALGDGDGYYTTPVVAGDHVVVGGQAPSGGGYVAAYTRDGDRRWVQRTDTEVWNIAPVDNRVYAVTKGGSLYTFS